MISLQDSRILCADELAPMATTHWFGLEGSLTASGVYHSIKPVSVGGRNAAWFVEHELFSGVLRQYRRGGLVGKLIKQSYCWAGAEQTRAWAEFKVLDYLYKQDFPVPKPLAAMYVKHGFIYQGALITTVIPGAKTLIEAILQTPEQEWSVLAIKVARVIAQMHLLKVNHADLNAFNILLDNQGNVYIIDFDKARIEAAQAQWCEGNINRLGRHLQKVLGERGKNFLVYIRQNLVKI